MAPAIYLLCAVTALASFALLFRSWLRTRAALLFWSALCFAGLSVNNVLLVVDKLLLPTGGHNFKTFRKYIPPSIAWLSAHLKGE